jgi:hypothetical protein
MFSRGRRGLQFKYLFESMFNDHLSVRVGYPGEEISDCAIRLLIYLVLRLGYRFYEAGGGGRIRNNRLANDLAGLINDTFSEMIPGPVNMFGDLRVFFFPGLRIYQ